MSIREIALKGTREAMGREYGETLAEDIHALAQERLRLTLADLERAGVASGEEACLSIARRMLKAQAEWRPDVHEEFTGIAQGAEIEPERLLIGNGYTDFRDVAIQSEPSHLSECTSFLVSSDVTKDGTPYLGQTWDMHNTAQPYIVVVRREPEDGPRTISLTTAGCLSLIGINEFGIGVGNNNLVPTDARVGVIYLAMIHAALQCHSFADSRRIFLEAPRASGHHYLLTDAAGNQCGIETSGTRHRVFTSKNGVYVHANHYLAEELPTAPDTPNSRRRHDNLSAGLRRAAENLDADRLKEALEDRGGAPDCVCRYGDEEITGGVPGSPPARTCAAILIDPSRLGMWVTDGPPDQGDWEWVGLSTS